MKNINMVPLIVLLTTINISFGADLASETDFMLEDGAKEESVYNISLRIYTLQEWGTPPLKKKKISIYKVCFMPNKCTVRWNLHVFISFLEFQNMHAHINNYQWLVYYSYQLSHNFSTNSLLTKRCWSRNLLWAVFMLHTSFKNSQNSKAWKQIATLVLVGEKTPSLFWT